MARFWVLMTVAVAGLLAALSAMSEDDPSASRGKSVSLQRSDREPVPALRSTEARGTASTVAPGPATSRRSYERRHQRTSALERTPKLEASPVQTGSIVLAHVSQSDLPPVATTDLAPVPLALDAAAVAATPQPAATIGKKVPRRVRAAATGHGSHATVARRSGSRSAHAVSGSRRLAARRLVNSESLWPRALRDGS